MSDSIRAVADAESLRRLLKGLPEVEEETRRNVRRDLRRSGDEIIAEQKAALDAPLPSGLRKVGQERRLTVSKRSGKFYVARRNVYAETGDAGGRSGALRRSTRTTNHKDGSQTTKTSESRGMREGIKRALVTRVVAGKNRQGVQLQAKRSPVDPMPLAWQSRRFRHKVFGREPWVYQQGNPYFVEPVIAGRERMYNRIAEILGDAIDKR